MDFGVEGGPACLVHHVCVGATLAVDEFADYVGVACVVGGFVDHADEEDAEGGVAATLGPVGY